MNFVEVFNEVESVPSLLTAIAGEATSTEVPLHILISLPIQEDKQSL